MQYSTLFYILSAILIFTSILNIVSNKFILSSLLLICFMFSVGILFFSLNSIVCGVFQILLTILSVGLLILLYRKLPSKIQNENVFKTKNFWTGVFTILVLIVIAWLFIYYYISLNAKENLLIFSDKAVILPSLSVLITTKSIFIDYFISYFYTILIFIITIGGIYLLIRRNTRGEKDD